jgi:hypothetical protein
MLLDNDIVAIDDVTVTSLVTLLLLGLSFQLYQVPPGPNVIKLLLSVIY